MENKTTPLNWRQKHFINDTDTTHPYRLTCPCLSLTALKFSSLREAQQGLTTAKEAGIQAILSKVDTKLCKIKVIGYSAPTKIFKRKE